MELVYPSEKYRDSYLAAIEEFGGEKLLTNFDHDLAQKDFSVFVQYLRERAEGKNLPPDFVPETILWIIDHDEYVGRVSIRHQLTEHLLREGGHIGYDVRPSKRKMGYGSAALLCALPIARELGLHKILLTYDDTNVASQKIIEKAGGVLENSVPVEGKPNKLRYWIKV